MAQPPIEAGDELLMRTYRSDTWMIPGYEEAARALVKNSGSVFAAWEELSLGFDPMSAYEYLTGMFDSMKVPKHERARALGAFLAFAMIAVHADRLSGDRTGGNDAPRP